MRNCAAFAIFRFNYATSMKTEKGRLENHRRAETYTEFCKQFIVAFTNRSFREWVRYYFEEETSGDSYKTQPLKEIKAQYGVEYLHQRGGVYFAVPLNQPAVVAFFEQYKPDWAYRVSRA